MNVPDLAHSTSEMGPLYPNYRVSCIDIEAGCSNKPLNRTKEEKCGEEEEDEAWNPKIIRQPFSMEKVPVQKTKRRIKVTDRAKKC
jgi:hypothetical protein